uniref:NPHS2 stomatin family member, podocin n=1 Tax=Oryzias melastigma TaxID=30732 RepID=A0A3B3BEM7_ORYME
LDTARSGDGKSLKCSGKSPSKSDAQKRKGKGSEPTEDRAGERGQCPRKGGEPGAAGSSRFSAGLKNKNLGVFEWLLMVFALALVLLFFPFSIWFCVKVVREHERAVIFRLGHRLQGKPKGPGLLFYLPFLDVCHKVDIRLRMLKVPLHTVVTKDLARPELSVVCYYQIENVALCSAALSSLTSVLQSVVQAAVRDVLAQHSFSHILLHRRRIGEKIKAGVDSVACRWGIRMERADIDELFLPVELQQTLATEAEAKRQQQIRVSSWYLEFAFSRLKLQSGTTLQPSLQVLYLLQRCLESLFSTQGSLLSAPHSHLRITDKTGEIHFTFQRNCLKIPENSTNMVF